MSSQIASQERPFQNGCATPKMATFPILRVLVVRVSTKEIIVENVSTKDSIVEDIPVGK